MDFNSCWTYKWGLLIFTGVWWYLVMIGDVCSCLSCYGPGSELLKQWEKECSTYLLKVVVCACVRSCVSPRVCVWKSAHAPVLYIYIHVTRLLATLSHTHTHLTHVSTHIHTHTHACHTRMQTDTSAMFARVNTSDVTPCDVWVQITGRVTNDSCQHDTITRYLHNWVRLTNEMANAKRNQTESNSLSQTQTVIVKHKQS